MKIPIGAGMAGGWPRRDTAARRRPRPGRARRARCCASAASIRWSRSRWSSTTRVIGVVHAGSEAYAQFDDDDVRLLELIADRIALAISRGRALRGGAGGAGAARSSSARRAWLLASSLDLEMTLPRAGAARGHALRRCCDRRSARRRDDRACRDRGRGRPSISGVMREGLLANPPSPGDTGGSAKVIRTGRAEMLARPGRRPDAVARRDARPTGNHADGRAAAAALPRLHAAASRATAPSVCWRSIRTSRELQHEATSRPSRELAARAAVAVDNAHLYRRRRASAATGWRSSPRRASSSARDLDVDRTLERLGRLLVDELCRLGARSTSRGDEADERRSPYADREAERRRGQPALEPEPRARRCSSQGDRDPAGPSWRPTRCRSRRERRAFAPDPSRWLRASRTLGTHDAGPSARAAGAVRRRGSRVRARTSRAAPRSRSTTRSSTAQAEERAQAARVLASVGDGVFFVDRHGRRAHLEPRCGQPRPGSRSPTCVDRPAVEAIPGWAEIVDARPDRRRRAARAPRAESLPLDLGDARAVALDPRRRRADGIVYAFRDLTEERALETMRTEFVSTVSHELRTPLAAIYGAAMTLRRSDVALDDDQRANAARRRLGRGRPARAHGQRHPLGEPARHRHAARVDPELRPAARSRATSSRRSSRTSTARTSSCSTRRAEAARRRRRPGQGRPRPDQPRRQRDQVLARRRPRSTCRVAPAGAPRPLLGHRPGARGPAGGAAADLREVLPPRSEHEPRRRRHRARPLHLPRARAPDGGPRSGSSPPGSAPARPSTSSCRPPATSPRTCGKQLTRDGPLTGALRMRSCAALASVARGGRRPRRSCGGGAPPTPPQLDQNIIERTRPIAPTTIRITPMVLMSRPETVALTAQVRIAPTAIRIRLTPIPIS